MRLASTVSLLLGDEGNGVFPDKRLLDALDEGVIRGGGYEIPPSSFQPASLDLRLGEIAYRLQCSFLPGSDTVEDKLKNYREDTLDLHSTGGVVLEPGRPYLIPLKEEVHLPPHVRAKANPKSSTGRIDVFTRVITDRSSRFDEIVAGYSGRLYLEVAPLSFPIRVREDLTLNQLRLAVGSTAVRDAELRAVHEHTPLLYRDGQPYRFDDLPLFDGELFLSLDLRGHGNTSQIGYKARENAPHLDLTTQGPTDPNGYWEPVTSDAHGRVILTKNRFYLLMSKEAVEIPPTLAAEMAAYDPTSGELRTHYAGFFDPGFGHDPFGGFHGSRAALEVRAHDIPFVIEDGQRVCKLTFERMLEPPLTPYGFGVGSSYQRQEETLAKYFYRRTPVLSSDPDLRTQHDDNQLAFPLT